VRGELDKRQWVVFDGDVDPEWVENLNSVLDDNKRLTLPNGERLAIPPNVSLREGNLKAVQVRIIFEVADLKYATLATVSRCGMVWFSDEVVTTEMLFERALHRLRYSKLEQKSALADAPPVLEVYLLAVRRTQGSAGRRVAVAIHRRAESLRRCALASS